MCSKALLSYGARDSGTDPGPGAAGLQANGLVCLGPSGSPEVEGLQKDAGSGTNPWNESAPLPKSRPHRSQ